MEKRITSIQVDKQSAPIKARGETRGIKIYGTQSSGFSLEVNDSTGYCILENPLQDIEIPQSGVYILNQNFPDISTNATGGLVEEYYEITITPHADVTTEFKTESITESKEYKEYVDFIEKYPKSESYGDPGPERKITPSEQESHKEITKLFRKIPKPVRYDSLEKITLYQYPDPTITLTTTIPTEVITAVAGGSDITIKSTADSIVPITKTQTLTITEGGDGGDIAGFFYVKDNFNNSISKNTTFKKVVTTSEDPKIYGNIILKPSTTRTVNDVITQDIEPGMTVYGKITKDKIVYKSLEVPTCQRATNKFELSDTVGLFPGMIGKVNGLHNFRLTSVDCSKNITINQKVVIFENTKITFVYEANSAISNIKTQSDENGNACVDLTTPIMVVDGMSLDLDDDESMVSSSFKATGSGTNSVVITNDIVFSSFGKKDVTYTLDLPNIITRTPNARNFKIEATRNRKSVITTTINTLEDERDASTKTIAITSGPNHGAASISSRNIVYTPNMGYVGVDKILYTFSDGTNTSAEARIDITVK